MSHEGPAQSPAGNPDHIAAVKEIARLIPIMLRASEADNRQDGNDNVAAAFRASGMDPTGVFRYGVLSTCKRKVRAIWREWRESHTDPLDLRGADFSDLLLLGFEFDDADMTGAIFDNGETLVPIAAHQGVGPG